MVTNVARTAYMQHQRPMPNHDNRVGYSTASARMAEALSGTRSFFSTDET